MKEVTFTRSAEVEWQGEVSRGTGVAVASSGAFRTPVTFPTLRGEPDGTTTPEELLAASHATCYAIGLRSVIARSGGSAARIVVTATVTAEKGSGGIRILRSHLEGLVDGLAGIDSAGLTDCAEAAKLECTITNVLRGSVDVTHDVRAGTDTCEA
ncbi:MAG: OsmC family protein [Longimicrobiales bacterium]